MVDIVVAPLKMKKAYSINDSTGRDVQGSLRDLKALSLIISESIKLIEQTAIDEDLEFPSIDTPYSETSEEIRKIPVVADSIFNIVSAATRLVAIVRPPPNTILLNCSIDSIPSALLAAVEMHVVEVLREAGPQGLHVDEIALISKTDPNKLARILRHLATESIFREISPDVFANNRISSCLDTGKRLEELRNNAINKHVESSGISACVVSCVRHVGKALPCLSDTLLDPSYAKSYDPEKTAFSRAFKLNGSFFTWLEQEGNEKERTAFGCAMNGLRNIVSLNGQMGHRLISFSWEKLQPGSVVVDVGGGVGSQTLTIASAYPDLKFVVQDREQVIKDAHAFWEHEYPEALTSARVKLQVIDFFIEQPTKNASVYLLSQVLHDWPDDLCVTILKHIRDAAGPNTHLLISERLIMYACDEDAMYYETSEPYTEVEAETKTPPKPLLPNGGHSMSLAYISDMQMMALLNGQERTFNQYRALLEKSGWNIIKVYKQSYITFPELQIIAVIA